MCKTHIEYQIMEAFAMTKIENLLIYFPVSENFKDELEKMLPETKIFYRNQSDITQEDVAAADVIFGNVSRKLLENAPRLRWLHLSSAGTDGYTPLMDRGVLLTNGTGAYNDTIAEHMLALTSALCIRLPSYFRLQREHVWQRAEWSGHIMGATVAVLGCGNIGCAYARRMKVLGAHTIGVRRSAGALPEGVDEMYTMAQLDEVLPRADIVAMVMPGTPETKGIMDARRIGLMKDGALLINVGRGNALDPDALYDGLTSGKLGGAAIDVAYREPLPAEDRLWDAPNLIITPHVAGGWNLDAVNADPVMVEQVCKVFSVNLKQYLAGEPMKNQVDKETGYTKSSR